MLKVGRWSSGGTFTTFNLRDLYLQADSLQKMLVAAGGVVSAPVCLAIVAFHCPFTLLATFRNLVGPLLLTPFLKGGGVGGGPKVPRETPEP